MLPKEILLSWTICFTKSSKKKYISTGLAGFLNHHQQHVYIYIWYLYIYGIYIYIYVCHPYLFTTQDC